MRVKTDFTTNSSSASFLMVIESDVPSLDEFVDLFNQFLTRWEDMHDYLGYRVPRLLSPMEVTQEVPGRFVVQDWTSMYNGHENIPKYIRWLIIEQNIQRSLEEDFGFKNIKLHVHKDG